MSSISKAFNKGGGHVAALGLFAGVVASLSGFGLASAQETADIQVVATLVSSISQELVRLPCSASSEDIEAAIMFRISQSGTANDAAVKALGQVRVQPNMCANAIVAIDNVIRNLRKSRGGAAVAAFGGGQDAFFSAPSAGTGGGANYSSQP